MRLVGAGIGALLLLTGYGSATGLASDVQDRKLAPACFSLESLAKSLPGYGAGLSVTHLIAGSEAQFWVAEVARKTGAPFKADEVATVEGREIAPMVMLVFATAGCASNVVWLRLIPDAEI